MEAKAMVPRVAIGYGCAGVAELLACLVVFSSATGAQTLMPASGPGGLVRLFTSDAAILEAQETRKDIPCTATPVKPALGFDLQEAGEIFLGQIGNVGVGDERPLQWKADNAITLADTSGIEMIADFASYQFGGRGKRIERQHDREGLQKLHGTVGAA